MTKRANPAVSAAQYGMAQAVLSGASTGMPVGVARELVEKTSPAMRRKFAKELAHNPVTYILEGIHRISGRKVVLQSGDDPTVLEQYKPYFERETLAQYYVNTPHSGFANDQRPVYKDIKIVKRKRRTNPESDAASMYESFHGTPSTGELVIQDQIHYHGNLAELGVLCGLKVRVVTGEDFTLEFGTPGREANPKGKGKRKRSKRGPLTTAYSTAQGIVPGLLGIGDGVIRGVTGNPKFAPPKNTSEAFKAGYRYYQSRYRTAKGSFSVADGARRYSQKFGEKDMDVAYMPESVKAHVRAAKEAYDQFLDGTVMAHEDRIKAQHPEDEENPQRRNPGSDSGPVILCSNETGNQLYFRGGDQSLDLDSLNLADAARDHMVIGEVWALAYATKKDFDEFAEIEYVHTLGLEKYHVKLPAKADLWEDAQPPKDDAFSCGNLPTLMYDSMNKSLSIAGGIYKIEKPWAETSPGIEN